MNRFRTLFCVLSFMALAASLAWGAAADDREAVKADGTAFRTFAPVQEGFTIQAETALPYAPDRLLVQFKAEALGKSFELAVPMTMGAHVKDAVTGFAELDEMLEEAGAVSLERPYDAPRNLDKAADLGVDRWFMYRFEGAPDLEDLAAMVRADKNVQALSLDSIA